MRMEHRLGSWAIEKPLFPKHMSFLVGPRQSGKTTLALGYLKEARLSKDDHYYNWDRSDVRRRFREGIDWISSLKKTGSKPLLVFDEIHKVRQWKNILKGIYDHYRDDFQFIVTGSGRLDFFQRGGDSLAGRYDPYFLSPFTPGEVAGFEPLNKLTLDAVLGAAGLPEELVKQWELLGGFPEPFLSSREGLAKVWWRQYQQRVTEEDLRDLTRLESVDLMREVIALLPERMGSPLSLESIRRDVETSFATVKRYVATLNQLFVTFEVAPYSKKIHRAVKKEKKLYFYHHPAVTEAGPRFENMVALLLKRWVSEQNERAQGEYGLFYLRDQDRREVDFLLCFEGNPFMLFEAKSSDPAPTAALRYYSEKLKIPGIQVVRTNGISVKKGPSLGSVSIHRLARALG